MTQNEFDSLSDHLRSIVDNIPLNWGAIQNDSSDSQMKRLGYNIFDIGTLDELEDVLTKIPKKYHNYYYHRWYLLQCSLCEEFLFYKNENVVPNPQTKSKCWDIRIDRQYEIRGEQFLSSHYFDVKGSRIPTQFIKEHMGNAQNWNTVVDETKNNPRDLIRFYYDNQSDGIRLDMQNRLFFVHYSFADYKREMRLRIEWDTKAAAAKAFIDNINDIVLYSYRGCTAGIIYIFERQNDVSEFFIPGLE